MAANPKERMRYLVMKLAFGIVGVACLYLAAPALSAPMSNAAATRAYLRASDAYAQSVNRETTGMVNAIDAREKAIAGQCPAILTYAPRDEAFQELGEEMSISLLSGAEASVRLATLRLAGAIERLAWSNRKLTGLVHGEADEERAIAELDVPDVCAQIEAWKAGGYALLPPEASSLVEHMEAVTAGSTVGPSGESRESVIMRLLKPYEMQAEQPLVEGIERRQAQIEKRVTMAVSAALTKLAVALGVSKL